VPANKQKSLADWYQYKGRWMAQGARRRIDASVRDPSYRAICNYKEFPLRGMKREPFQPWEKANLKVMCLDVHTLEEICSVAHVGEPSFEGGLFKIAGCRKQSPS
jgi:hypothetical protein